MNAPKKAPCLARCRRSRFVKSSPAPRDIASGCSITSMFRNAESLAKRVIRAERAQFVGRDADRASRQPVEHLLIRRPGADIDGVLQASGYRAIVLRRGEQDRVGIRDVRMKPRPFWGGSASRSSFQALNSIKVLSGLSMCDSKPNRVGGLG